MSLVQKQRCRDGLHRKNRPRSRYPFRRKTVSVITEYAGVRGTPLYIHRGLRADRGETPWVRTESAIFPSLHRTDSVYYRTDSVYSVADSVRTPCILRTGSVRMLETAKRSPVSNGLDDARFSPFSVACCLRHRFQTMDRNRKSHMYKHQHTGMMKNKELPHY